MVPLLNMKARKFTSGGLIVLFGYMVLFDAFTTELIAYGVPAHATIMILILLGLLSSIRWRLKLSYSHHHPALQKVQRRKVNAVTLATLLCYWALLSFSIVKKLGPLNLALGFGGWPTFAFWILHFSTLGIGVFACIRWFRKLKKKEEAYYEQLNEEIRN